MKASRSAGVWTRSTLTEGSRRDFCGRPSSGAGVVSAEMGSWASSDMVVLREPRGRGSFVVVGEPPRVASAVGQLPELVGSLDDRARHVAERFLHHAVELLARRDLEVGGTPGRRFHHVEDALRNAAGAAEGAVARFGGTVGGGDEARRLGVRI